MILMNNVNVFICIVVIWIKDGFIKLIKLLKFIMLCWFYVLLVYDCINYNLLMYEIVEKYEVNIYMLYLILYFSWILFYFIFLFKIECFIFK